MAIVINGSGTVTGLAVGGLPDGTVDAGTLATDSVVAAKLGTDAVTADALKSDAITDADLPAGSVLQVVQTTKTDTASHTGTSWSSAIMSASITPTSTSSKILVMYSATMVCGGDNYETYTSLWRGSTQIFLADAAGSRGRSSGVVGKVDAYAGETLSQQYLDSPSSSNSVTYSLKVRSSGSVVAYVNRGETDRDNADYDFRGASSLTLMEIGA